jgi:exopolyphosphatase/guanosine-5'-triphosphate,3'-diphosphate pyrophosphatase
MSSLSGIVPRWEWRTFGESFGSAEERLIASAPDRVQESDEVYLLSLASEASVKVRDDLMDVKQLETTNDDGLEQWRPVMKASFPLTATDVGSLLSALGAPTTSLMRESYSLDELIDEIVEPSDQLRAVRVHKHREHFTPGGCMAELSELRTDAGSTRTIAIESEDPELVTATIRGLALDDRPNVCVSRGLKQLVGFE